MTPSLAVLAGVLLSAFVSMVIFAVAGPGRDADATRKGSRFLLGVGDFLVHWFMWVLGPAERLSLRLGLGPDFYNFTGLACGLLSGILIALGELELGGWAIALGGVCDILDGRLARAMGVASPYGQFIDATLDRFVETCAFLGFAIHLRDFALGPFLAAAALSGSLLVSYTRARGESVGVLCTAGLMQRAERLMLTLFVCLFDPTLTGWLGRPTGWLVYWTLGLIAVLTFGTAVYRTAWIGARLRGGGEKRQKGG